MELWLEPIEDDYFKRNVEIRFNNILDGFDSYKNRNIKPLMKSDFKISEKAFINFFQEAYKLNSELGGCIVEVYFNKLNKDELYKLVQGLDESDIGKINDIMEYLSQNKNIDTIYYEIKDIDIISVLTKMCTRELFFVTFYFTNIPITIWGNYNLCFPLFYIKESHLDNYIEIIKKYSLEIM